MKPARLRFVLGIASLVILLLISFLIHLVIDQARSSDNYFSYVGILTVIMNLLLIFLWIGLGRFVGSIVSFVLLFSVTQGYLIRGYQPFYAITFLVTVIVGYRFCKKFLILEQEIKVENEKVEEGMNIIKDELEGAKNEITLLERRLARYTELSKITEKFSSTLSEEYVTKVIVENTYDLFGKSDRGLLFRVDTDKQALILVYSKKTSDMPQIRQKKGDIFDRWVFWKKQPLIVEDIRRDFRFSFDEERIDKGFRSLMSSPLVSGETVFGLLRMDSRKTYFYSQDDLRLLDIISGLAAVALENAILYKRLNELAITDGLTGLYVQKFFKERLRKEIQRSIRSEKPFSLLVIDIDDFKNYNDKYGHMAGDLVLKHIAFLFNDSLEPGDIAARYGGEEFAAILMGKNKQEAVKFAEALRKNIEETPIVLRREKTYVTVSIGIASFPSDSIMADDLFRYADRRLYKAKDKGKNQTCAS